MGSESRDGEGTQGDPTAACRRKEEAGEWGGGGVVLGHGGHSACEERENGANRPQAAQKVADALPVQPGSGSPVRPGLCPAARPADCWSLPAAPACPPSPSPGNDASHAGPGLCNLPRSALRLLPRARFPARAPVRWGRGKSSPGGHTRGPGACRHFRSRWTPLWDTLLDSGGVRRC